MEGHCGRTEQVLWPISVFSGIIMCKFVYEVTHKISLVYINGYSKLSKLEKIISLGYFLSDLAMILWLFPSLGGKEYVSHHGLSMCSIFLCLISGKAHLYILMVLFTEATTPFVNLRWYLDLSGQKSSNTYIYNGVALFLGWLVARILLFIYFFTHMYLHFDQVKTIFPLRVLQSADGTSDDGGDECIMVLENIQGHGNYYYYYYYYYMQNETARPSNISSFTIVQGIYDKRRSVCTLRSPSSEARCGCMYGTMNM